MYPSNVIEKPQNKYLGSTAQHLFTIEKHNIFKRTACNFFQAYYKPLASSWVKNHSKCIRKMSLCFGAGSWNIYSTWYQFSTVWYHWCHNSSCIVYSEKTLCTMWSVSEIGDMDSSDPKHRITLCQINSIKTHNDDGYLINMDIVPNWYVETVHDLLEVIPTK